MKSKTLDESELRKLFHIDISKISNRIIPVIPVVDRSGNFFCWTLVKGKVHQLKGTIPIEGLYFAKKANSESDFFSKFLNFVYQRTTIRGVFPYTEFIRNDVLNLSACLAKFNFYFDNKEQLVIKRFVVTEVEYIFSVCRSLYDLFQIIAKYYWSNIKFFNRAKPKKELNGSFAKMALYCGQAQTVEDLQEKYGLTPLFAKFYTEQASFFKILRGYRDDITHKGLTPGDIFITEKGFAVRSNYKPFSSFGVWNKKTFLPNNLAPLIPIIAYVIQHTFSAMDQFIDVLKVEFKFPDEIAPGYRVYLRGHHTEKLVKLSDMITKDIWHS